MAQGKGVSKNNTEKRSKSREYLYQGQKIKPVKIISTTRSFLAASYSENNKLVLGKGGEAMSWKEAINS